MPCDLLICEMKGPRAFVMTRAGTVAWADTAHRGRWVETDARTGKHIIGAVGYRTARWFTKAGVLANTWTLPTAVVGEIYGLRVCGAQMVITTWQPNNYCELWIFDLDADGYPVDGGVKFSGFEGFNKFSRSALIYEGRVWIAAMNVPANANGAQGALEAYDLATGDLIESHPGNYPNDVDVLPTGEIVWIDEHFDRLRCVLPGGEPRTLMAGSLSRATYDLDGPVSAYTNDVQQRTLDGSKLSGLAVEYAGLNTLYAPNGVTAITSTLFAIADTDNSRVIVARVSDTWRPEVVAVIHPLNEPTKVRISRVNPIV